MESQTASSTVRLNLNGNNATATAGNEYFLVETAGAFSVESIATVDADNGGEVDFSPAPATSPTIRAPSRSRSNGTAKRAAWVSLVAVRGYQRGAATRGQRNEATVPPRSPVSKLAWEISQA